MSKGRNVVVPLAVWINPEQVSEIFRGKLAEIIGQRFIRRATLLGGGTDELVRVEERCGSHCNDVEISEGSVHDSKNLVIVAAIHLQEALKYDAEADKKVQGKVSE